MASDRLDLIPAELKERNQWVVWRYEERGEKRTKAPYQARFGEVAAKSDDPGTWRPFAAAVRHARRFDGIGYVLAADDPYCGIDLDGGWSPEEGELEEWAAEWVGKLSSYTEITPSGKGLHVIVRAALPEGKGHKGPRVEMYDRGRYFTMTGNVLCPRIEDRQAAVEAMVAALFPAKQPIVKPSPSPTVTADDRAVIDKVRKTAKWDSLWRGDWSGYPSQSEADLALAGRIAFFAGPDAARIADLFRQSGLYREKWDSPHHGTSGSTYGADTVQACLSGKTAFYEWKKNKKGASVDWKCRKATPPIRAYTDPSVEELSRACTATSVEVSTLSNFPEEIEPFPVWALPAILSRFVLEAAESFPVPPDFIAVPLLAVCGAAIGRSRLLQVRPGWLEDARIWSAVIGDPGEKKTPAIKLVKKPIERQQARLEKQYEEEKAAYDKAVQQYEADVASWTDARKKAGKSSKLFDDPRPEPPEEPQMIQLFTTDTTVEALAEVIKINPRGIILMRDELTAWARGMDQYKSGKGSDRQAWLSFWSGDSLMINRKDGKRPLFLRDVFVAVSGCLPPEVLGEFMDEKGREDGFIHRILFAYPKPVVRRWTDASVSAAAMDGYEEALRTLASLHGVKDENQADVPLVLDFTREGKKAFSSWATDHYQESQDPDFSRGLQGPWAKMDGYCATMALILQVLRWVTDETDEVNVDETSVKGAIAIMAYHKSAARRIYPRIKATEEDQQVDKAIQWIERHGGHTTAREILQNKVGGVKSTTEAKRLLVELEDRQYGEIEEGSRKDSIIFRMQDATLHFYTRG